MINKVFRRVEQNKKYLDAQLSPERDLRIIRNLSLEGWVYLQAMLAPLRPPQPQAIRALARRARGDEVVHGLVTFAVPWTRSPNRGVKVVVVRE